MHHTVACIPVRLSMCVHVHVQVSLCEIGLNLLQLGGSWCKIIVSNLLQDYLAFDPQWLLISSDKTSGVPDTTKSTPAVTATRPRTAPYT